MVPVLGYARPDRPERGNRYERSSSPSSHESSGSATSKPGFANRRGDAAAADPLARQRSGSQVSAMSLGSAPVAPPPVPPNPQAGADLPTGQSAPTEPRPRRGSQVAAAGARIEDYCFGTPHKVNSSHSGAVELSVALQEKAVFLPTLHRQQRRRSRERRGLYDTEEPEESVSVLQVGERYAEPDEPEPEADDEMAALHISPEDLGLDIRTGGISEDSSQQAPCAMLQGSVLMKLTKATRIKEVGLTFYCVSRTLWNLLPQPALLMDSALPNSAQVEDMAYLGVHHWDFVPLEQFGRSQAAYDKNNGEQSATLIGQDLYGADVAIFRSEPDRVVHRKFTRVHSNKSCRLRGTAAHQIPVFTPLASQPRKLKQSTVQADGVLFPAGEYVYHFTLLVDARTPGSVSVPNGQVKFLLAPKVVRTGAFTPNLSGKTEVDVVRAPYDAQDGASQGPVNDSILLSRMWDERFVYSVNVERRNITLDVPVNMTIALLPLPGRHVKVHQIQVYAMESVSYIYSLDSAIRYVDPSLKLLLFQKDAPGDHSKRAAGTLLHPTEPVEVKFKLLLMSSKNADPRYAGPHPFARGKFGELRFLQPDVRGPYIRVKHRLLVVLRVSREADDGVGRSHFEVKIDTPITILSRHCVRANINLPSYTAEHSDGEYEEPPSFDDAMEHKLLGPSGAPQANPRGIKATADP